MKKWEHRHSGPELMDGTALPDDDLFLNYKELHFINRWLGGYRITLKGLKVFVEKDKVLSVLDAGCGGGDMLKVVAMWGRKNKVKLQLTGIDLSAAAIRYAQQNCRDYPEISLLQGDIFTHLEQGNSYDVIMQTLLTHHFTDQQVAQLLRLMHDTVRIGFLINDLQRHAFAYCSIQWLTQLFSSSYLVKHDAPLSVLRGFHREEWYELLSEALVANASVSWEWAFRYLVVFKR